MLTNLEIKNGEMTPKYDIYNDVYTVIIEDDVTNLDIYYEITNEVDVFITGNENILKDKGVGVIVQGNSEERIIRLNVIKKKSDVASNLNNYVTALEAKRKEEAPEFLAPLIGSGCFLLIIIIFSILFHKRKKIK